MFFSEEKYKSQVIDDVCRFVRIPSRSSTHGGEEGKLQVLIADLMRQAGARVQTFEADDVPEFYSHRLCYGHNRKYKGRPTVIGEIGPEDAEALLILAHSDTVQINSPEDWSFNPFCGCVQDGKILGLGSTDDKWGLAVMLAIMRALQERKNSLRKKVIFASTIDEENGVGNGTLLLGLRLKNVQVQEALYLDGLGMQVLIGNLGGSNLYLRPKNSTVLSRHSKLLSDMCTKFSKDRSSLFLHPYFEGNARRNNSIIMRQSHDESGQFFLIAFYTLPEEFCKELEKRIAECLSQSPKEITGKTAEITTTTKQDRFVLSNYFNIPTISFGPRNIYSPSLESGRRGNHQPDEYIDVEELWLGTKAAYQLRKKKLIKDGKIANANLQLMRGEDVIKSVCELIKNQNDVLLCTWDKCKPCCGTRKKLGLVDC